MLIWTISWGFSLIISLAFWGHNILGRLIEKMILSTPRDCDVAHERINPCTGLLVSPEVVLIQITFSITAFL